MEDTIYPVLVYIYDEKGFHRGSVPARNRIELDAMFHGPVKKAIQEKREVRMTDTGDLMLFHTYKGCIKWDGAKHHSCKNCYMEGDSN